MPVRDLSDAADDLTGAATQFCVIGAGIAGLTLARKLALAGRKVVVVESGKTEFDEKIHSLNQIVDSNQLYTRSLDGRYRGLGGSSSRWGGRMIPISAEDVQPRDYLSLPGWPIRFEDLALHTAEIETLFGLAPGSYSDAPPQRPRASCAFPPHDPDFACRWPKWINFRQCNLAAVLKSELRSIANLSIYLDATVTGFALDTEKGNMRALQARNREGKRLDIEAEHFVIAAGAIETTRLLLWLDAISGARAFAGCRSLGHYFQDHLKAEIGQISRADAAFTDRLFSYHFVDGTRRSLHLDLTAPAQRMDGIGSAFAFPSIEFTGTGLGKVKTLVRNVQRHQVRLRDFTSLSKDIGLLARSAYWRYGLHQLYIPAQAALHMQDCVEQMPHHANRISLSAERDYLQVPKVLLDWKPMPSDERSFQAVVRRLKAYWDRSGLSKRAPMCWKDDGGADAPPIIERARAFAHPSGTTRMGTNAADSVVTPDLRCHAVPNLSIASTSVFPVAGSANPTLTLLQLTLRLSERLLSSSVSLPLRARSTPLQSAQEV